MPDFSDAIKAMAGAEQGGDMGPWNENKWPYENPENWKQKRWNKLKVFEKPEDWVYLDGHKTHNDWYNKNNIAMFVEAAKKYGVDPYDFTALGISESGLGNVDGINLTRALYPAKTATKGDPNVRGRWESLQYKGSPRTMEEEAELDPLRKKMFIETGAEYLKLMTDKFPGNRTAAIQAYSGEGSQPIHMYKNSFGKTWGKGSGRDMWKEHPQANRVIELSNLIRNNPEIKTIIDSIIKKDKPKSPLQADINMLMGD
jgi:hypothetical protein